MQKPWYVYIVRCSDNSLYTGISLDVERRFAEHSAQGKKCAKYLRGKAPLELVFQTKITCKSEALKLEYKIKKLPKYQKELITEFSPMSK